MSKARVGPSGLSTIILVFFALGAAANMRTMTQLALLTPDVPLQTRASLVAGTALTASGIYLYYAYQSRCRPWMGWLLFSLVVSFGAGSHALSQRRATQKREDHAAS